jgi:hypothetical protein
MSGKPSAFHRGAFTVESQVYNPNLKTKETIKTPIHTESCKADHPIPVPLFPKE